MDAQGNNTPASPVAWLPKPDHTAAALPPLTKEERAEAVLLARRLQSELAEVIALLPESDRGASAMSRALRLDRATCQRIVAGCIQPDPGVELLTNLPGIQGLRQFIDAVDRLGTTDSTREILASAAAAVDVFEQALDRLAGSQRRLKARLMADVPTFDGPIGQRVDAQAPADDPSLREALFRSAASIVGRWSQLSIDARIVGPADGDPNRTEGARIRALIGHIAGPQAIPLEVGETSSMRALDGSSPAFATLDTKPASGATPQSLLTDFCSRPLPRVITRAWGTKSVHTLDLEGAPGNPHDIVLAHRNAAPDAHPSTLNPPIGEMWWLASFPTRRMQFDVFVHKDVLRNAVAAMEVHLWGPDVGRPGTTRWTTRFPGGPGLERLGRGLARAGDCTFERYDGVLATVFDRLGWDASQFEGFRCEAVYPVWRSGYCMRFDFGHTESDHPQ